MAHRPQPSRRGQALRSRLGHGLGRIHTAGLVLAASVLAAVVAGAALGYRLLEVRSGSMSPAIEVGDLVLSRQVHPSQLRPGAIVTFRDPYLGQRLVTHRVVSVSPGPRKVDVVTKGDANSSPERWNIPANGTVGEAVAVLPGLGPLAAWLSGPLAWAAALILAAAWLAWTSLGWIWSGSQRPAERP
jgi:signal peptidase